MSEEINLEDVAVKVPKGFRTAKNWAKKDRWIRKGEKASWFNGKAYFSKNQLSPKRSIYYAVNWGFYGDYPGDYMEQEF